MKLKKVMGILALIALACVFTACDDGSGNNSNNDDDPGLTVTALYYAGSTIIYPATPLDELKADLTVKASYEDGAVNELNAADYTLSVSGGELVLGINIVTVTYRGKTANFTVVVIEPPKPIESISATYVQGSTKIYPATPLNALKPGLTVTATFDDGSTDTLFAADYTLRGTLTVGVSTVTVDCEGKTDTFEVTVYEPVATGVLFSLEEWLMDPPPNFYSSSSPRPLARSGGTCIPELLEEANGVYVAILIPPRMESEPWHGLNIYINGEGGGSSNHGYGLDLDCVANIYEITVEGYIVDAPVVGESIIIHVADEMDTIFTIDSEPLTTAGETFTITGILPEDARTMGPEYGNPNTRIRIRGEHVNFETPFVVTKIEIKEIGPR
jgi:hypothetical protein